MDAPAYHLFIFCKQEFSSQFMNLDMQYFLVVTLQLGAVPKLAMQLVFTMEQAHLPFRLSSTLHRDGRAKPGVVGHFFT